MTPEQQRIAIGKACGFEPFSKPESAFGSWFTPDTPKNRREWTQSTVLPDYLNDLNAMYRAENTLSEQQRSMFLYLLHGENVTDKIWNLVHTSAAQRAEAFLRALNLWNTENT